MDREELAHWLRLQLTPGIGNASARKLLAAFGLPDSIFQQTPSALAQVVSSNQAQALLHAPEGWQSLCDTTWDWLQQDPASRRVLPLGDAAYPQRLLRLEDPPLLLYAMAPAASWAANAINQADSRCMAVVGSRNPTPQGLANARQFSLALATQGLCIVSGMALGVDGVAHEGALEGAGAEAVDQAEPGRLATIAVVGTGLDRVYPRQHRVLAHRIAQRGMLLSEYALGTPPLAANFPKRNRIIAGLAHGTLVVEAALQSGSLITAQLAVEQGSEVFAIPGSIHATQSRGCHALIKQGAKLVESAQDVLEELGWDAGPALTRPAKPGLDTELDASDESAADPHGPGSSRLLQALGFDPTSLDALQARTGMDTPSLQAALMTLELAGEVARLPGGLFQRQAQA